MRYAYHMLPQDMKGEMLYPLNILNQKFPSIYNKEVAKYKHRPHILNITIPIHNCLWNDVLHLTFVHPKRIRNLLNKANIQTRKMTFLKIPIDQLDHKKCVIYFFKKKSKEYYSPDQFERFNLNHFERYKRLKESTFNSYIEYKNEGKRPLLFMYVPHLLYKGTIFIKGLEVVEV
jgi:hypothetical protein